MAEKVLLNTPHVLSALSPANSRYSRPRRWPLRASGRLLGLAAEGDLVAPWRCSCTSRTLVSLGREAKAAPRSAHERVGGRGLCAASGLVAQGARGAFKNAVPAGTLAALRERLQAEDEQRIGGRSSAGGAELLDPVPLRSTSAGVGPLDQHPRCLVAPLTSAHNYPATTLQRRQTLRPEFPADCPVVAWLDQPSCRGRSGRAAPGPGQRC